MNNVNLIGRLTRDPELKFIPNTGMAVCTFTLAVNKELSRDKKDEMQRQGKPTADFPLITVFGSTAESCANYLKKGSMAGVSGAISTSTYDDKNGNKVYKTTVIASRVDFLTPKSEQAHEKQKHTQPSSTPESRQAKYDDFPDFEDDDIFQPTDDDYIPI